jgi:hypothetical protein
MNSTPAAYAYMSLFEPETAADTLIMAAIAAMLLSCGNDSEGPEAERDLKLAEEFAWKVKDRYVMLSEQLLNIPAQLLAPHETA